MQVLNFPAYQFKLKSSENKQYIFDVARKKYIVLTPEEWVRQHVLHFLVHDKKYPLSLTAVEKQLSVNNLKKRTDILIYNTQGTPELVVECKAPNIKVTQHTFDQIARYNLQLKANYLMVSNGFKHYFCKLDYENERYIFLKDIPEYT